VLQFLTSPDSDRAYVFLWNNAAHNMLPSGWRITMFRTMVFALAVASASALTATPTLANDNCQRLEALAQQYAGVELTSYQRGLKAELAHWYNQNCRNRRTAQN
jgi:hypothetical protein